MIEAMMIFDKWWWMILPGILLGLYAQMKLTSTYNRYSRVPTNSGRSGAQAAREILDSAGLHSMAINEVPGHLTDHYDPRKKALFLSAENYHEQAVERGAGAGQEADRQSGPRFLAHPIGLGAFRHFFHTPDLRPSRDGRRPALIRPGESGSNSRGRLGVGTRGGRAALERQIARGDPSAEG